MLDVELLQVLNQIPAAIEKAFTAFIERHPGHANQKTHGNRYGGFSVSKESLRRLKDDKGARESYKARARKKLGTEAKPERKPGAKRKQGFDLESIHQSTRPIGEALSATANVNRDKTKVFFGIGRRFKSGQFSGGTVTWDVKNKKWFGTPRTIANIKIGFGIND